MHQTAMEEVGKKSLMIGESASKAKMNYFLEYIATDRDLEALAFMPFIHKEDNGKCGTISAGVAREILAAFERGLPVYEVNPVHKENIKQIPPEGPLHTELQRMAQHDFFVDTETNLPSGLWLDDSSRRVQTVPETRHFIQAMRAEQHSTLSPCYVA